MPKGSSQLYFIMFQSQALLLELVARHDDMCRGPSFLRHLTLHLHINPFYLVNLHVVPQKVLLHMRNENAQ